jgi:hydrogenase expression/formation protein HypC
MCLGLTCQVAAVTGDGRALVDHGGRLTAVSLLTLDEPVHPGEWLLVHAGFALARLSEEQVADARELRATTEKGWT